MDLYNLLRYDHETVKSLFREIEATSPKALKKREELFGEINMELTVHALAEEKFLYPRLLEVKESQDLTMEAMQEHKLVEKLLKELARDSKDGAEWLAKLKVLVEKVEHHIEKEEESLFKLAKKHLSQEEAGEIADDIESFKEDQAEVVGEAE